MSDSGYNTLLLATLELAEFLGVSRHTVLDHVGLEEGAATIPGARLPVGKMIDAMEFAAARTGRGDFGMAAAERRDHLSLGLLGTLLEQCRSVAEIDAAADRFLHLQNTAVKFKLSRNGIVRFSINAVSHHAPRHYVEAMVGVYVRIAALVLGPRWRPAAVYFRHNQIGGRAGYERRFGRGVKFGQKFNGIAFRPDEIERKAPRNPETKLKLEKLLCELTAVGVSRDLKDDVARLARLLLPSRDANIARIAGLLNIPSRSLQRKLSASGTSFGAILAETRFAMANEYLRIDGLSVVQLAPLLGFSEPSAVSRFLRAHRRATAHAPKRGAVAPPS